MSSNIYKISTARGHWPTTYIKSDNEGDAIDKYCRDNNLLPPPQCRGLLFGFDAKDIDNPEADPIYFSMSELEVQDADD